MHGEPGAGRDIYRNAAFGTILGICCWKASGSGRHDAVLRAQLDEGTSPVAGGKDPFGERAGLLGRD
jgi:hypothetical protein